MPSEARIESVPCLMVRGDIPADICAEEQRPDACRGCTAATRRCVNCGKPNGIVNAEVGLCGKCLAQAGESPDAPEDQEEILSFESVFKKASKVGRPEAPLSPAQATAREQVHQLGASPLLRDPLALYRLLMQHATELQGAWVTPMPVAILMRRAHLMRMECYGVLSRLEADGFLTGESPWDAVTLLKTEDLEEEKASVETVGVRGQLIKSKTRSIKGLHAGSYGAPRDASTGRHRRSAGPWGWGKRKLSGSKTAQRKVTLQEIAEFLKRKAVPVNGERLVPGVVPTLQMQFHLRTPDVIAMLTTLSDCGFLGQKDEWRTVILLRDDAVPEVEECQLEAGQASAAEGEHEQREAVQTAPALPVPSPPAQAPSLPAAPPSASPKKPAGPTYAEMFAFLVQKSVETQGERRTGGALPQLQIRFKLSVADVRAAMEWFVANGHVEQRDGWRTVALLSKAIDSTKSLKTAVAPKCSVKPRSKRPAARTAKASAPSAQRPVSPGPDRLKKTVAALERDNAVLRGQQDEILRKLKALETQIAPRPAKGASSAASPRPSTRRSRPKLPKGAHRMNKEKLIAYLAEVCQMTKGQAETVVEEFVHVVINVLQGGGSVQIVGFGEFHAKVRKGRKGVDPRTLKTAQIPEVVVPKFNAGKRLKDALKAGPKKGSG